MTSVDRCSCATLFGKTLLVIRYSLFVIGYSLKIERSTNDLGFGFDFDFDFGFGFDFGFSKSERSERSNNE
ncbi:MAG: hypothetical protein COA51_10430 [Idiomarina sp.]|nr:MAG: hypothetical protein COA51_10430 [Idiomarina sp.]